MLCVYFLFRKAIHRWPCSDRHEVIAVIAAIVQINKKPPPKLELGWMISFLSFVNTYACFHCSADLDIHH